VSRKLIVGLATLAAALAVAGSAHASSIVFIRGGDIFLTTPDGSRELQVTQGGDFNDVTQADDGRIFATEPPGILYSFSPGGRLLAGPAGTGHTLDIDVNPSGTKIAFWYLTSGGERYTVMNSDGSPAPEWDDQNGCYPTWITDDLTLDSNCAGYIGTTEAGPGGWQNWFSAPDGRKHSSAITRAQDRLVVVWRDYDGVGPWKIYYYSNSATPPRDGGLEPPPESEQPTPRCVGDFGDVEPSHPSFSPDGTQIAWEFPQGIEIAPVLDIETCSRPAGGFAIPGAKSPDFGPADVPEAQPPVTVECVVPKVKGKKLGKAKKRVKRANCKVGKVKRKNSRKRRNTVLKQRPGAGKQRPAGTKVKLWVAR
jgi:hypothetical protein